MSDEKEYYVVECEEEYEDEECQLTIDDYLYSLSSKTADEEDVRQVLLEFKSIEMEFNDLMTKRSTLLERRRAVLAALKDYTQGKPLVVSLNNKDGDTWKRETHIVKVTDIGVSFLNVDSVSI